MSPDQIATPDDEAVFEGTINCIDRLAQILVDVPRLSKKWIVGVL
jgi:hypothetical protein